MTTDELIRMAREAGAVFPADGSFHSFEIDGSLERFAALIAAAEREACAKVCDDWADALDRHKWPTPYECAEAIRARGQA